MASRTGSLLAQRAEERQEKRNELLNARNTNIQQYVKRLADNSAPKTVGGANRALPQEAKEKKEPSRLVQEMQAMTERLNNPKQSAEEKQKEAREARESDIRIKREDRQHEETNRNFNALNNVFKGQTEKIVDAVEQLNKQMRRQAAAANSGGGGGGGGPSLLEQLMEEREKRKAKKQGNAPASESESGGGSSEGGADRNAARDAKRERRLNRMRQQRGGGKGLRGAWNRARGFGSAAVERGESLLERGEGLVDKIGNSRVMKIGGKVLSAAALADTAYNAAPLVGDVFDSEKDTADRVKAGAHLAVTGAGGVIGGILGGTQGAAMGAQAGDAVASGAEWLGDKFAENVDIYDLIHDKDSVLNKTLGSVATGYDAIVSSDFGKTLGVTAAIGMAPFSEDARKALRDDWEHEILPKFGDKFDSLSNALGNYGQALSRAGSEIMGGLKNAGGNIVDGFKDAGGQIADGWKKNGIVGALQAVRGTASKIGAGFGRAYDSAKEGVANAGSSVAYGLKKGTKSDTELAMGFSAKKGFKGMTDSESKAYAATVMKTESGGRLDIVNDYGYSGQYQFGSEALADGGFIDKDKLKAAKAASKDWNAKNGGQKRFLEDESNWTNPGGRKEFLNNKQIQDDAFVAYTNRNIDAGYRSGALSSKSTPAEIAAYAKAAHLKGSGGADDWFLRGKDSTDANGTRVSSYASQAKNELGDIVAKVDAAKKNGYVVPKDEVSVAKADAAKPTTSAAAKAVAASTKPAVVGHVSSTKDAQATPDETPTLAETFGTAESPWRVTARKIAAAEKEAAKATPVGTVTNSPNTATASAAAQPMQMVNKNTPAETQNVTVTNPTPPSEASNTIVQAGGGGGGNNAPMLDEIPMYINDMGLVLLNMGHV